MLLLQQIVDFFIDLFKFLLPLHLNLFVPNKQMSQLTVEIKIFDQELELINT